MIAHNSQKFSLLILQFYGLVNNCEIITFSSSEPYSSRGYNFTITKEVDKNTPILINAMSEGKDNLSGTIDMSGYYRVRFIGGQIKEDHIDPRGEDEGPEENIVIHVKYIRWEHYQKTIKTIINISNGSGEQPDSDLAMNVIMMCIMQQIT